MALHFGRGDFDALQRVATFVVSVGCRENSVVPAGSTATLASRRIEPWSIRTSEYILMRAANHNAVTGRRAICGASFRLMGLVGDLDERHAGARL